MKRLLIIIAVLMTLCPDIYSTGRKAEESPAVKMVMSHKKAIKMEGAMLKMARPFMKKTPVAAILDEMRMIVICPVEEDDKEFTERAENLFVSYSKVAQINDETSQMAIFIDSPHEGNFSEIILYITDPERVIMIFEGDFTIDSLKRMGEISRQQAKH